MTLPDSDRPLVSVVVPVYNDPTGIEKTLESLLTQTYPTDAHEVLVVDNGSTDRTRAVISEYAEAHDHVRQLVEDEVQGPAAARNRGVRSAEGEILAFLDADLIVPPDHLDRGVARMRDEGVDYLGCDVEAYTHGSRSLVEKYDESLAFPAAHYFEAKRFGLTGALFVTASVFREVGPFDEWLIASEDEEFGGRVHRAGISQAFAPDLTVYHPTRSSVRELVEKHVGKGRGYYLLHRRYPNRYGPVWTAFSPRRLLPSRLEPLRERCRCWSRLSHAEKLAFYLLSYVATLSSTAGSIAELLEDAARGGEKSSGVRRR